jgi:AraC-like DNA-binding protein/ligand-binding sensor protein
MAQDNIEFQDLCPLSIFEEFGAMFFKLFGIATNFWNAQDIDDKMHEWHLGDWPLFCQLIWNSPQGKARCLVPERESTQRAVETGQPCQYRCHAGLVNVLVPIVFEGKVKAILAAGQMLTRPPEENSRAEVYALAHDLGLDPEQLYHAYCDCPLIPPDKLEELIKFLSLFCNYIASLGRDLLLLRRREDSDVVGRVREFLRREYHQEDLSLSCIAAHVHRSAAHLSRLFHHQTGETITTYLNHVRIEEARKLLAHTRMTVSEVCFAVGYQSLSHFTRTFKALTGMAPKFYRQQQIVTSATSRTGQKASIPKTAQK